MKVKDLLKEIKNNIKEYPGFLDWDVYTEQLNSRERAYKKRKHIKNLPSNDKKQGQGWKVIKDGDGWEYFACEGYWSKFEKKKIFTINVNF